MSVVAYLCLFPLTLHNVVPQPTQCTRTSDNTKESRTSISIHVSLDVFQRAQFEAKKSVIESRSFSTVYRNSDYLAVEILSSVIDYILLYYMQNY